MSFVLQYRTCQYIEAGFQSSILYSDKKYSAKLSIYTVGVPNPFGFTLTLSTTTKNLFRGAPNFLNYYYKNSQRYNGNTEN